MTENDPTKDLNGEGPTKDLTEDLISQMNDSDRLAWLMRTVGAMDARLQQVERLVARDTNPLPDNYNVRFAGMEHSLREVHVQLREMREDLERERRLRFNVEDRLTALEATGQANNPV